VATDKRDQGSGEEKERSTFTEEDRTPVEEMTTLGQCRYCENDAKRLAPHKDGTGWIAICDEHEKEARNDDFEPEKEAHASAS
jgi:hypothetical protein